MYRIVWEADVKREKLLLSMTLNHLHPHTPARTPEPNFRAPLWPGVLEMKTPRLNLVHSPPPVTCGFFVCWYCLVLLMVRTITTKINITYWCCTYITSSIRSVRSSGVLRSDEVSRHICIPAIEDDLFIMASEDMRKGKPRPHPEGQQTFPFSTLHQDSLTLPDTHTRSPRQTRS